MSYGVLFLGIVVAVREIGAEEKGVPAAQSGCLPVTTDYQCASEHRDMLEGIVGMSSSLFGCSRSQGEFVDLRGAGITFEEEYP